MLIYDCQLEVEREDIVEFSFSPSDTGSADHNVTKYTDTELFIIV